MELCLLCGSGEFFAPKRVIKNQMMMVKPGSQPPVRCSWATGDLMIRYHDEEWGVPAHDDRTLFEFLILEGAQAGLSWSTILNKRNNYRRAFEGFDPERVAGYDRRRVGQLLRDPGIVRNQLKIASTIANAKAFLHVQDEFGSFDRYIWQFVDGKPRLNSPRSLKQVPARTPQSDAMSKDLKHRGFNFVGSTICYAFMQAVGLVNDHTVDCFRYPGKESVAKSKLLNCTNSAAFGAGPLE